MSNVIVAYAVSVIILSAYAWSVHHRRRAVEQLWSARMEDGEAGALGPGSSREYAPTDSRESGGKNDD